MSEEGHSSERSSREASGVESISIDQASVRLQVRRFEDEVKVRRLIVLGLRIHRGGEMGKALRSSWQQ
jgi:hypothetical protein